MIDAWVGGSEGMGGRKGKREKQLLMERPQMTASRPQESADVSVCPDYGVRKGCDKGMDGEVKRRKVMEHPTYSS